MSLLPSLHLTMGLLVMSSSVTWLEYIDRPPVFIEGLKEDLTASMEVSLLSEEYHDFSFWESGISGLISMMLEYFNFCS